MGGPAGGQRGRPFPGALPTEPRGGSKRARGKRLTRPGVALVFQWDLRVRREQVPPPELLPSP